MPVAVDNSCSDTALLSRILEPASPRCREAAWREFLHRFGAVARKCIGKAIGFAAHVDDIEDVFAELCVSLVQDDMRKLRVFDPSRCKLSTWIGTLASHAACDFVRAVRNRATAAPDGVRESASQSWSLSADSRSATDDLIAQAHRRALRDLLPRLTQDEQRFAELYYDREMSPAEVAREMGTAIKTVYTKRFKVEEKLTRLARASEH